MAPSSLLSATLGCCSTVSQSGTCQNIDDPNHLARRSSTLPTLKRLIHLFFRVMGRSNNLFDSSQIPSRPSQRSALALATRDRTARSCVHAFMAHCHRELYHAQWAIILDDGSLWGYVHGIVIDSYNGIWRHFRVYSRIFVYSADYREK
jgi:hypothetical protein